MTTADLTADTVAQFRAALQGGEALNLLVGAGASVSAGLPTWTDLAANLVLGSGVATTDDEAYQFLAGQDILLALEAVKAGRGPSWWEKKLRSALYGDAVKGKFAPIRPADLHYSVADLIIDPPLPFTSVRCATLNYDLLIEDALQIRGYDAEPRTAGGGSSKAIWHLHGKLPPTGPAEGIVLTLTDYLTLAAESAAWQMNVLHNFRYTGPLVMVGTSYSDMDIRTWFDAFKADPSVKPAINIVSREGLGLPRAQFDKVLPALSAQWGALGITVVPVHDHVDAAQLLREIAFINNERYIAPSDRLASVYQAHSGDHFASVQARYSEYLDEEHAKFQELLGSACNTTLWLANSDNRLTRWATNGRRYTDEASLRRVEGDHDSNWAVARCFSRGAAHTWQDESRDPEGPSRWCTVVATPVRVTLPESASFVAAVFTVASTKRLSQSETEGVAEASQRAVERWSERLEHACAPG